MGNRRLFVFIELLEGQYIFEIGAGYEPTYLFEQIKEYTQFIIPFGFEVENSMDGVLLDLMEGIEKDIPECIKWSGNVDQAYNMVNRK